MKKATIFSNWKHLKVQEYSKKSKINNGNASKDLRNLETMCIGYRLC